MLRIVVERAGEIISDSSFDKGVVSIGRNEENDVVLDDSAVSSIHLVVKRSSDGTGFHLLDQSANGSFVAGERVNDTARIELPSMVTIAGYELTLIPLINRGSTVEHTKVDLRATTEIEQLSARDLVSMKERSNSRSDAELRIRQEDGTYQTFVFSESAMIGRTAECDIQFTSPDVSRQHCHVFSSGTYYVVRRLSTVNGVQVNGYDLHENESVRLSDGDVINVCENELLFLSPATRSKSAPPSFVAEAMPNHDLVVNRRGAAHPDVTTFEIIGFLGAKTFAKFESELLHEVRRLRNVILDFGYLIGIDAAGLASLAKVVREALKSRTAIRLVRLAPRINDILQASPLSQVLIPHVSRSEESAVRILRQ